MLFEATAPILLNQLAEVRALNQASTLLPILHKLEDDVENLPGRGPLFQKLLEALGREQTFMLPAVDDAGYRSEIRENL